MKRKINIIISACIFLLVSCASKPQRIGNTNEYKLAYCQKEIDCFKAAEKTCPNGYRITSYRFRPEKFICEN